MDETWFESLWRGELRVLVVVAHPDDETIGAGALLTRISDVTVAWATDGDHEIRRAEAEAALDLADIGSDRRCWLGFTDRRAALDLRRLTRAVRGLVAHVRPDLVLTHPYEGGHPDHDAVAFAAARCGAPVVEMAGYHRGPEGMQVGDFLPNGPPARIHWLSPDERAHKRRMLAAHATQRCALVPFGVEAERYRRAPAYDFTRAPHDGRLHYECEGWFDGEAFRRLAKEAGPC